LSSDSEKEENEVNEKLGLDEKEIVELKELGIDYYDTSEK